MKNLICLILVFSLLFPSAIYAADTKLSALDALAAVADADLIYIVDVTDTSSKKMTVLNLFDTIDTFAELNTIVVGKTLVNEEDAVTWDALGTFGLGLTITTGDPFTFGVNRIDNGSDLLDGDMIGADTIDDDSIDFSDITFADFDFETNWKMWHSDGSGDVTEITLGANGTFLESNGAAAAPAFRVLAAGDIPDISATYEVQLTNEAGLYAVLADVTDFLQSADLNTFAELNTMVADKTLVNEEDAVAWDALGTFGLGVTITTGDPLTFGVNRIDNGSDLLDGEMIGADTIDNDSIDWGDMTDLTTDGAVVWGNIAEGELTNASVIDADIKDDTIQEPALNITNAGAAGVDNYLLSYNHAGTNFTWVLAGAGDLLADASVPMTSDWDIGNFDITLKSLTGDGTIAGATLTEGGNAVPNATDHLGFFGGTTSAELLDEISDETGTGKAAFATAPVFTTSIQLTGADADPAAAAGTIAYDNAIANILAGGALRWYDNDSVRVIVDLETDPADDDYVVAYDAAADGFYMKVDDDTGGATPWDDIVDPDAAATVDFVTYTQTIDIGKSDSGGGSGLILDVTGLGAGTDDVIALEITTAADWDSDFVPISIYNNSGADNDLIFKIDYFGALYLKEGAKISNANDTEIFFTDNSDIFYMTFGGTDVDLSWSDGALNIRNAEDGIDAIVNIQGKDASEKGILRVMSDGDDNYIELHHDDSDGHILTDTGDIHIEPAGGDVSLAASNLDTTGNVDFGGADLELPQASPGVPDADGEIELDFTDGKMVIQHGAAHAELGGATDVVMGSLIESWSGTIYEPDGVNDVITVKAINSIEFPHGVVITAVYLGVSSDTNYVLTVQNFDDFDTINAGDGTIDTVTYTADTTGEIIDTTPTYATIAAGQIIMISIPSTNVDWIHFEIYYYEPAA